MARRTLARRTHTRGALYLRDPNEGGGGGNAGAGSSGGDNGGQAGGDNAGAGSSSSSSSSSSGSFTQADVDRLIGERLERERKAAEQRQAAAARTEAQRIADLERDLEETRTAARRTKVAAKHGLADYEDLLGSGTDEELDAKAKRLVAGGLGTKAGGNGGGGTGGKGRARTTGRTVTENGGQALTPKERAAMALRGIRGGGTDTAAD